MPTRWQTALTDALPRYRNRAFISTDPMRFPHAVRDDWHRCELAAFLAAVMSYGQRPVIINTLHHLWERLEGDPWLAVSQGQSKQIQKALKGFVYRFYTAKDWAWFLERLSWAYETHGSLEALWLASSPAEASFQEQMAGFTQALMGSEPRTGWRYGQKYLLPDASKNGACKRLHLFLRWVVRDDADLAEPVDFGLWRQRLSPAKLLIPVDTHVGRLAHQWRLCHRKTLDWQAAEAITAKLRKLNKTDPTSYDFALLGLGLEQNTEKKRNKLVTSR